jgi:hypothetical protein
MSRARAQIRRPLDSRAQVTISIVDTRGRCSASCARPTRRSSAPTSACKRRARRHFFSGAQAGPTLRDPAPTCGVRHRDADLPGDSGGADRQISPYSDRANGNLSRPYFPDGEVGRPNGPFSRPIAQFNPFSTGLQSALIIGNLAAHLAS